MTTRETLTPVAIEVLESLHQHRLLTSDHIHALHTPSTSRRWTRRLLSDLATHGLIDFVPGPSPRRLWHVTPAGVDALDQLGDRTEQRPKPTTPAQAAGPLRHHTLAVNDAALAWVHAARQHGDDCGPLAWRHEVAHPLGPPPGQRRGELLIADALLTYLQLDDDGAGTVHRRFLELDRGTRPVEDLAAQLARYARLHTHRPDPGQPPAWRHHYPTFPPVHVLLAAHGRTRPETRLEHLVGLTANDPTLTAVPEVEISIAPLTDLLDAGPFAPIFLNPRHPDRLVNWLGHPEEAS